MEKLKSIDFRVAMLVVLALATPFCSPNVALPVAIIAFSGLIAMNKWFTEQKKPNVDEELRKELSGIKNQMSSIMIKNAQKPEDMAKELKRFF